jgi:hypothetical protein
VRDRIFPLVKRKFVLQAPPKNRHGQHKQSKREQESETALPRRIAKVPHDSNDAPKPARVVTPLANSFAISSCPNQSGVKLLLRSVPATNQRVPHISLVFCEMWDTTAPNLRLQEPVLPQDQRESTGGPRSPQLLNQQLSKSGRTLRKSTAENDGRSPSTAFAALRPTYPPASYILSLTVSKG